MHQRVDVVGSELQRLREVADRPLEIALARVVDDAAVEIRSDVLRIELDRLGVVDRGLVRLVERVIGEAALEVGEGEVRIEADALGEVGDRLLDIVSIEIDAAARHEGTGFERIEADRLVEVGKRQIVFLLGHVSRAALETGMRDLRPMAYGLGIFRTELQHVTCQQSEAQCLAEVDDRLVRFLFLSIGDAAVDQRVDFLGVDLEHLGEVGDRLVVKTLLRIIDDAAIDQRIDVDRIDAMRLGVVRDRIVGLVDRVVGDAAVQVGIFVARRQPDRRGKVCDRGLELFFVHVGRGPADEMRGGCGIEPDGVVEVGNRLVEKRTRLRWRLAGLVEIDQPALVEGIACLERVRERGKVCGSRSGRRWRTGDRRHARTVAQDAERLGEIRNRLIEVALALVDEAAVLPGRHFTAIDLDRRVEVGDRAFVVVLLRVKNNAAIDVGVGLARREANRVAVIDDCLIGVSDHLEDRTALKQDRAVGRRHPDHIRENTEGLLVIGERARLIAAAGKRGGAIVECHGEADALERAAFKSLGADLDFFGGFQAVRSVAGVRERFFGRAFSGTANSGLRASRPGRQAGAEDRNTQYGPKQFAWHYPSLRLAGLQGGHHYHNSLPTLN